MDLISVIVPVYNVEKYLDKCVTSVIGQTYSNLEIILVADGTPDRSGVMCDEYAAKDPRIKVVHKENGGLGSARNAGLDAATGDYVVFIDSDDWVDKDHVQTLYERLKEKSADICYCGCTRHYSTGEETTYRNVLIPDVYEADEVRDNILLMMIGTPLEDRVDVRVQQSVCMSIYDLNIIQTNQIRFVSERMIIAEDLFFNVDYLMHVKRACSTGAYSYYYLLNTQSISQKYDERRYQRTVGFYHYLMGKMDATGLDKALYELRVKRSFLVKVRVLFKQILSSDMSKKEKRAAIEKIVNDETVVEVIKDFPVEKCVFDTRIILEQVKEKRIGRLILLLKAKILADKMPAIRSTLNRMRFKAKKT